jgi:hypothetical protein
MAALDNPGNVVNVQTITLPAARQVAMLWDLKLQSSSDTLNVPALASTDAVSSLTTGVTATNSDTPNEGEASIVIASGSEGQRVVVATLHRVGMSNNLTIDEDPT